MNIVINPGSGPVNNAIEANAADNMTVFIGNLRDAGHDVGTFTRRPDADYGQGRYAFDIAMTDGRSIEIQMPGLPVDRIRYMAEDGQDIWDYSRLYVDGSSWVWKFALSVVARALGEGSS